MPNIHKNNIIMNNRKYAIVGCVEPLMSSILLPELQNAGIDADIVINVDSLQEMDAKTIITPNKPVIEAFIPQHYQGSYNIDNRASRRKAARKAKKY